jgi:5-methylcytosine-specific restriction endonuclease McrA
MAADPKLEKVKTRGVPRSPRWPSLRKAFLAKNGSCAVCGGKRKLQAHHILPFHNHPDLELDPQNLLALCEGGKTLNCHLRFGHWNDFGDKWNPNIREEAPQWLARFSAESMGVYLARWAD